MSAQPALDAHLLIETLGMAPHPEGGWYAETYRAPAPPGTRPAASAIYFLLQQGERSHWHRVDACEVWLWHAGSPLLLHRSPDGRETQTIVLGADIAAGERPQAVVPAEGWQSAESTGGWSLVSCIVAPAFAFAGFRLAAEGWSPGAPG